MWCYNEKRLKPWWYPTMDNSPWFFIFLAKLKQPVTLDTQSNSESRCIWSECKKVRLCRIFNKSRNIILSNYVVTKTDPMELKNGTDIQIEVRLSPRFCVKPRASKVVTCHVHFIVRNESSVFPNEISTLRIHSGCILKTQLSCAILQTVFSYASIMCLCFVNTTVSYQLILICFQNMFFEKEVCAPLFSPWPKYSTLRVRFP
jgi:hypothetical protein